MADINVEVALKEQKARKQVAREALKRRIGELINSGASRAEIIQRLGISSGHYYRVAVELGLIRRRE